MSQASSSSSGGGNCEDKQRKFERGDSIEVPLGKIEAELAHLWRIAAQPKPGEPRRAVTRACLWNFIVRVESEQALAAIKRLIDDVSAHVPARVLVAHVEPDRDDAPIRAWVEANWRRSGRDESGSDEVTLWASGAATERLPPLVRSLLVTDAPVAMLWWGRPPSEDAAARELLGDIDRLIIDSRRLDHESQLADYEALAERQPHLELVDCAWLGVRPLRGLAAGLFDGDPARLAQLDRVRVVSGVTGCQSRGLLTLGWLSSRLGWGAPRKAESSPQLRRWKAPGPRPGDGEITIELETRTGGAPHGVIGLELFAGRDQWLLRREGGKIDVGGPAIPPRCQPVRTHTDAELVVSGLGPRGRDPVYRAALAAAVQLVRAS